MWMGAWAADPTSHEGWNQDLVMVGFSDDALPLRRALRRVGAMMRTLEQSQ